MIEIPVIAFKRVKDPYGWLSNMSPHPVCGFKTAEALFQSMRFMPGNKIIEEIRDQKSPMGAKMVAKKHQDKMIIQPRSPKDIDLMAYVLSEKVTAHPDLAKQLIVSNGYIIEDVTSRPNGSGLFWGAAKVPNSPTVDLYATVCYKDDEGNSWVGSNVLGKLWMELRARLYIQSTGA